LLETIRSELSDPIAMAVAPTTEAKFTAELRDIIVTEAQSRRVELQTMEAALTQEIEQLETALTTTDPIMEWLVDADEISLVDLEFDELQARHATLETYRDSCEKLLTNRQEFLQQTTSRAAEAKITHYMLVEYLYEKLPVDYPVLSAGVRLDELCAESQQAVRDHLVRRV
jgi:DNA-binding protein H-NS